MSEHSALDEADFAVLIASQAPCYSEADRDCLLEMVDTARKTLTNVYVGGQEPGVPDDWKIGWFECRQRLQALEAALIRIERKFKATKFFAGQRRADKRKADNAKRETTWHDLDGIHEMNVKDAAGNTHTLREHAGEAQYQEYKRRGFDVRKVEYGKTVRYQFATRKD